MKTSEPHHLCRTNNEENKHNKEKTNNGCTTKKTPQVFTPKMSAINPVRPNNDVRQTSHCNIKGVSVSEVMRIENMITQVKF